ncbi:MAG: hypothetical protein FWG42_11410 [Clostridiales bacterium]|nr:hypothetical protein [Clostridiales bacterium]
MNRVLLDALAKSLILTIAFETGFFLLTGKRGKKDLLLVVLANVLTNPVVVLLYWLSAYYTEWNSAIVLTPLELFAILTEGYCYRKYGQGFKRPYLFSLAANVFSFWVGVLIQLLA